MYWPSELFGRPLLDYVQNNPLSMIVDLAADPKIPGNEVLLKVKLPQPTVTPATEETVDHPIVGISVDPNWCLKSAALSVNILVTHL